MLVFMGLSAMWLFSFVGIQAEEDVRVVIGGCFGVFVGIVATIIELFDVRKNLKSGSAANITPAVNRLATVSVGQFEDHMVLASFV